MAMSRISELRQRADAAMAQRTAAGIALKNARKAMAAADEHFANADEAQQIVQVVAETIQEEAHSRIAAVVSKCLGIVFDEPYEFYIRFERARGRTEARLVFVREGQDVNPIDASGGGVVDVAAFALRLSALMLARPARRRTVILDEPFKFVSAGHRDAVRVMLETLSADLGVQFIMVTHIDELRTGNIIDLAS